MKVVGNIFKWVGITVYLVCAVAIVMFLTPMGGWKALTVLTGSMRPTIQPGDIVIIHQVPIANLKIGNIVTYTDPHDAKITITHRIVAKPVDHGVQMIVTKGDANPDADPPFTAGLVVGREVMILVGAGWLIGLLHDPLALAVIVIIPGLIVIWAEFQRMRRNLAALRATEQESPAKKPATEPVEVSSNAAPKNVVPNKPAPNKKRPHNLDGMRPLVVLALVMVVLAGGKTWALKTTNTVSIKGVKFSAHVNSHPTTIADCFNNGWKQYGFKNQGLCVTYVVDQLIGSLPKPTPLPPLPPLPPIPTPKPIPTPAPITFHTAAASPSPSPSATP